MVIINSVKYNSYMDMCKAFHIDCKEFFEYKRNHIELNEMELLGYFIPDIGFNLETCHYVTRNRHVNQ